VIFLLKYQNEKIGKDVLILTLYIVINEKKLIPKKHPRRKNFPSRKKIDILDENERRDPRAPLFPL